MGELSREIYAERENVEKALDNLKIVMARPEKSVIELSAIATFLHNIYSGVENILKQALKIKDIQVPRSTTWHKDLLNFSVSSGIISERLSDELYRYMTFRHFFIHAYGFMLEEEQLKDLAENISTVWLQFLLEIEVYFRGD